jgi:hypothetical protein
MYPQVPEKGQSDQPTQHMFLTAEYLRGCVGGLDADFTASCIRLECYQTLYYTRDLGKSRGFSKHVVCSHTRALLLTPLLCLSA